MVLSRDCQPSPWTSFAGGVGRPDKSVETSHGHSQRSSPRSAEAVSREHGPGRHLGPPSVRKGSGESYPDPGGLTYTLSFRHARPTWFG